METWINGHAEKKERKQNFAIGPMEWNEKGEVKVTLIQDIHVTDENKMMALKASFALALSTVVFCILVVATLMNR